MPGKNTIKTPVINKNGVLTHVHKNLDKPTGAAGSRVAALSGSKKPVLTSKQKSLLEAAVRLDETHAQHQPHLVGHGSLVSGHDYRTAIALENKGLGSLRYQGPSLGWFAPNEAGRQFLSAKTSTSAAPARQQSWNERNPMSDLEANSNQPVVLDAEQAEHVVGFAGADVSFFTKDGRSIVRIAADLPIAEHYKDGYGDFDSDVTAEEVAENLDVRELTDELREYGITFEDTDEPGVFRATYDLELSNVSNMKDWDTLAWKVQSDPLIYPLGVITNNDYDFSNNPIMDAVKAQFE